MKVKEMQLHQRPREKALMHGIDALSNRELIALLLRNGTRSQSVLELADEVLNRYSSLGSLGQASLTELMEIDGIKQAKAIELQAAFALGKRIAFDVLKESEAISSPQKLSEWLMQQIGFQQQEHFLVVFLNQRNQILAYKTLFVGTLTSANVHPREIFKEAMRIGCAKIICAHNHPSGNPQVSDADIAITQQIMECGQLVSIPLLDHIVVGGNRYVSLREEGYMREI